MINRKSVIEFGLGCLTWIIILIVLYFIAHLIHGSERFNWMAARGEDSPKAYREYLDRFPLGRHANAAKQKLEYVLSVDCAHQKIQNDHWIDHTVRVYTSPARMQIVVTPDQILFYESKVEDSNRYGPGNPHFDLYRGRLIASFNYKCVSYDSKNETLGIAVTCDGKTNNVTLLGKAGGWGNWVEVELTGDTSFLPNSPETGRPCTEWSLY